MDRAQLETWAERAGQGDRAAMARLYDALSPRVFGFLRGLTGEPTQAEDLLQQTFLIAMERLGRRKRGDVRAWLFTIAHNLAIDRLRKQRRMSGAEVPDEADPAPLPAGIAAAGEMAEQVRREVAKLPESQREVILLRYYSEMSFKQIAEQLGCPLNTALTRAHYGLKKLREAMLCEA